MEISKYTNTQMYAVFSGVSEALRFEWSASQWLVSCASSAGTGSVPQRGLSIPWPECFQRCISQEISCFPGGFVRLSRKTDAESVEIRISVGYWTGESTENQDWVCDSE